MLNRDQEFIYKKFREFLYSKDTSFIIDGSGGTGKSYLVNELFKYRDSYLEDCNLLGIEPLIDWVITSTTNKACNVLPNCEGTIHSYLGLILKENYSTGESKLQRSGKWCIHYNEVIFIDECSMINYELFKYIQEGTSNCKIVYIGDSCQLAPVKESISPVYKQGYPMYRLNEYVRQGNKYLRELCDKCKQAVIAFDKGLTVDLVLPTQGNVLDKAQTMHMLQSFGSNDKVLAYTNKTVNEYISYIENMIKLLPERYTVGEKYVLNNVLEMNKMLLGHCEDEVLLKHLEKNAANKHGVFYHKAEILNLTSRNTIHTLVPADPKAHAQLLKQLAKDKNWYAYFTYKNSIADMRPTEACTVHKSQGSTYNTVFIDMNDLCTCTSNSQFYRLLYVACSRATNKVYFCGDIKSRLGRYDRL